MSRSFAFERLSSNSDLAHLEPEWRELFERSGTRNPFAHPTWVRVWLRHFAPKNEQRIIVAARLDGQLVAVAPFAVRSHSLGPLPARSLELVGAGAARADRLTEMSEILVVGEQRRRVMRELVHHLTLDRPADWDWLAVTLPPEHGWFENDWLPDAWLGEGRRAFHRASLPFVVMALPASWEELQLKRNMKEAIRRSKNRLAASNASNEVVFSEGASAAEAVVRLQELHSRRAQLSGHMAHADLFESDSTRRFARAAASELAVAGHATVAQLQVDGVAIAARLVLHGNRGIFFSCSGVEPEHWHLGAQTSLMAACLRRAIEQGDTLANFSLIPDSAKLRWSEQIEVRNEFVLVAPTRRAQRLFAAYWHLRAARSLRRA